MKVLDSSIFHTLTAYICTFFSLDNEKRIFIFLLPSTRPKLQSASFYGIFYRHQNFSAFTENL